MVTAGRTLLVLRGQESGAPEKPESYHGGFDDNHETDLLARDSWPLGKIRNLVIFLVKKNSHLPLKIPGEFKPLFTQNNPSVYLIRGLFRTSSPGMPFWGSALELTPISVC